MKIMRDINSYGPMEPLDTLIMCPWLVECKDTVGTKQTGTQTHQAWHEYI